MQMRVLSGSRYLLVPSDLVSRLGWKDDDFINLEVDLDEGTITYYKVEGSPSFF